MSAAYGGLCGGLLVLCQGGVNSQQFPLGFAITLLAIMVLGGIGTLSGAVIAGIIYAFSGTFVNQVNSWTGVNPTSRLGTNMQAILYGVVLILTMMLAPRGIAGLGSRVRGLIHRTK